jgi:hypothetical protein
VRRAKLYYLRGRSGKSARIAEKARSAVGSVAGATASGATVAVPASTDTPAIE